MSVIAKILNVNIISRCMNVKVCNFSKSSNSDTKSNSLTSQPPPPPPSGLCCMSGCANCVWIQHAEKLINYYKKTGEPTKKVLEIIDLEIDDENLKAYLKFEIRMMLRS